MMLYAAGARVKNAIHKKRRSPGVGASQDSNARRGGSRCLREVSQGRRRIPGRAPCAESPDDSDALVRAEPDQLPSRRNVRSLPMVVKSDLVAVFPDAESDPGAARAAELIFEPPSLPVPLGERKMDTDAVPPERFQRVPPLPCREPQDPKVPVQEAVDAPAHKRWDASVE